MASKTAVINVGDNIISTPGRAAGIVGHTAVDLLDTLNNVGHRSADIFKDTVSQVREIISASGQGNLAKRMVKIPTGVVLGTGKLVEGAVRSVVSPLLHGVGDVFHTVKNVFTNSYRAVTHMFSKKSATEYNYDKLKYRQTNTKGRSRLKLMPRNTSSHNDGSKKK